LKILSGFPFLGLANPMLDAEASEKRKKRLRIVQITDTHIQPEDNAPEYTRRCLDIIRDMKEKPDLIIHSGDVVMDAVEQTEERIQTQLNLWRNVTADLKTPIYYCIGNHDVSGLENDRNDPMFGKRWFVKEFNLPNRYYRIEHGGWHFIFLDSIHDLDGKWYTAKIDDAQFAWLRSELQKIPSTAPVMIVSHVPLLSASVFDASAKLTGQKWELSAAVLHSDTKELQELFRTHPNVKICVSGHIHLLDALTYNNVSYLGCGAVCADWWSNNVYHQTKAGFSVIDLYPDGKFERVYQTYDWNK
jgi:Icc protein